jgi:hypothetical protein
MSQTPEFDQAADAMLIINHKVAGVPLAAISAGKYQMFDEDGAVVLTKTLGFGLIFDSGAIRIQFTEQDTLNLHGTFAHECVVRDPQGKSIFVLKRPEKIKFEPTKARL